MFHLVLRSLAKFSELALLLAPRKKQVKLATRRVGRETPVQLVENSLYYRFPVVHARIEQRVRFLLRLRVLKVLGMQDVLHVLFGEVEHGGDGVLIVIFTLHVLKVIILSHHGIDGWNMEFGMSYH